MYHSPGIRRPSIEEEERMRMDTRAASTPSQQQQQQQSQQHQLHQQQQPHHGYSSRSPTMAQSAPHHGYMPATNGGIAPVPTQPSYSATYGSRPTSSATMQMNMGHSPSRPRPHSPTNGIAHSSRSTYGSRETQKSTYYDPTQDYRDGSSNWGAPAYNRSPVQHRESSYHDQKPDNISRSGHTSPTTSQSQKTNPFSNLQQHHSSRPETVNGTNEPPSPRNGTTQSSLSHIMNGTSSRPHESAARAEPKLETRRADPMSFSNILSDNTEPAPPKAIVKPTPRSADPHSETIQPPPISIKLESTPTPRPMEKLPPPVTSARKLVKKASPAGEMMTKSTSRSTSRSKPRASASAKKSITSAERDPTRLKQSMTGYEPSELSDLENDAPEWAAARAKHAAASLKRTRDVEETEAKKRKMRRGLALAGLERAFERTIDSGREAYRVKHEEEVATEVQLREVQDEKERKKDMQRKRRRERTVFNETQRHKELLEKAMLTGDLDERDKLFKEAEKAERKARSTKRILDNPNPGPLEDLEDSIVTPNLAGGTTGTLSFDVDTPEPAAKKQKRATGSRPKKSKEKKQAEKEAAEQGYAELLQRDELLPNLAPKAPFDSPIGTPVPDVVKKTRNRGSKKEEVEVPPPAQVAGSKAYWAMYDQLWKYMACKEIPKVYRIKLATEDVKTQNAKKTATLASKEARKYQLKTNKGAKDGAARSKRSIRETATFWKRNEKVERERAKFALKEETERLKKQAAEKEATRQKRKLEFLISQTELYSFFVNKEKDTDGGEKGAVAAPTDFGKIDFDDDDGTARHAAAKAVAEAAYKKAQEGRGELDFQNPTSLDEDDVSQPGLLACQLKEYQLKGLNWLRGLFVKGINGILADEMGLGKTVQSISILAWLAETQNIWGPFLVVAPASTLHNWVQELEKFVPDLRVLPYWSTQADRKILRKCWDRKHKTFTRDTPFHVMVTSYEMIVRDAPYFQKQEFKYMILDEAQAIKSSQSARWQILLKVKSDGQVLLTGTPIQNNMQELWALLHFIMPDLFDSHDEFSEWFAKDIENHAASHSKLDEEQLKRLHLVLKPFMLRRVKKDVQKELGDKIEIDISCALSHRQRAAYASLRDKVKLWDLMKNGGLDESSDAANTLMNLVVQLRKLCNHPDLFTRADTTSPFAFASFAATASFLREGKDIDCAYSTKSQIDYELPKLLCGPDGRLSVPGSSNSRAGFERRYLDNLLNIWSIENITEDATGNSAFSWLRFANASAAEVSKAAKSGLFARAVACVKDDSQLGRLGAIYDEGEDQGFNHAHSMFNIVERNDHRPLAEVTNNGYMKNLLNVSRRSYEASGLDIIEACGAPAALAPPIQIASSCQDAENERQRIFFDVNVRKALYKPSLKDEQALLEAKIDTQFWPTSGLLPAPDSQKSRFTKISVPSMRRFISDSGKLAQLDELLYKLKRDDHRVLLYFQMTRMMDLMEEYLTYRNYKYTRLDGSTTIENRRDRVQDFQSNPDIFVFLLSTRAGGLGINLTAADTVIFYDSDWNPTIDAQAMDRAHRLGQTRQVTVYRMITLGTVEERIRKRALQKQEVQQLVITGEASGGIDFNARDKDTRAKDYAMFLAEDDNEMAEIERQEAERAKELEKEKKKGGSRKKAAAKKKEVSLDDMYHEGEGDFDDPSAKPSAVATPMDSDAGGTTTKKSAPKGGRSRKAKTTKQRLAIIDGSGEI